MLRAIAQGIRRSITLVLLTGILVRRGIRNFKDVPKMAPVIDNLCDKSVLSWRNNLSLEH